MKLVLVCIVVAVFLGLLLPIFSKVKVAAPQIKDAAPSNDKPATLNGISASPPLPKVDYKADDHPAELVSIAITHAPSKLSYRVGDVFDPTGLAAVAIYSNGSTEGLALNKLTFTGFDSSSHKIGAQVITLAYQQKTATYTIDISGGGALLPAQNVLTENPLPHTTYLPVENPYEFQQQLDSIMIHSHYETAPEKKEKR